MTTSDKQKQVTPIWQKIALVIGSVVVSVLLVVLLLALFPDLIGDSTTRVEAGTTVEVVFRYTDGDYFFHQAGRVAPPEEDVIVSRHVLSWDENGFRVPAMQADQYPIAAFGDSFTEGTTVGAPWPDRLAAELNVPVENFGYRGYGPREIAATADEFAGDDPRTWVLYAHFSGNDLWNANQALQQELMQRNPFGQVAWIAERASGNFESRQIVLSEDGKYDYPAPVIIGGNYYELVFLEDLLWWQVAPEEGFLGTKTLEVIGDALDTVAANFREETCKAMIFVPSKEQLYYVYIHPNERRWLRENARATRVNRNGEVILERAPFTAEEEPAFVARLTDQRDAIRTLAQEQGWMFIDLFAPFMERVDAGELLYYHYDGHWNQAGHDLAAQIIADFMREAEGCPLQ